MQTFSLHTLWRAHLALLAVALIYGGNYTVAKLVMDPGYLQPLPFILLRAACATGLFWLFHWLWVHERLARADGWRVFWCAVFGVAVNQSLFFTGLKYTTPINASLIMTTTPILVLLISALVLGEAITTRKVVGIGLGAVGAIALIAYGKPLAYAPQQWLGNLLVLGNAASYGCYLVLVKTLLVRYHPITVIKWVFSLGLLLMLPIGIPGALATNWAALPPSAWLAVAYVLLGTTFLTYLFNGLALRVVSASTASIYIYLQPVFAGIIALSLGNEQLDIVKIAAALLIFSGVYLVSSKS